MDLIEFDTKITKLKNYHLNSAPEAVSQLDAWEKRMRRLMQEKAYLDLDVTKELLAGAKKRVKEISTILAFSRDLADSERVRLFERRAAYLWFVKMFSINYENEIKDIMEAVEYELEVVPEKSTSGRET
jgi:hypothetical protein